MSLKHVNCVLFIATLSVAAISTISADIVDEGQPIVRTPTATYRGKRIDVRPYKVPDFRGSVAAYTSIPYVEPPVGELRYRRAVPKVIEGDFDATRAPLACPQIEVPFFDMKLETSEDCLTLDIFVPEPQPSSAAVMVWIHGGGFTMGAGSLPIALPIPLAAMNDVIVVTFNYRLGVLGFLAPAGNDDEMPANLGHLDQREAIIWVNKHIAAFGGDPSRITIFGESAGSMSVSSLVASPMNAGLFTGAIMQSATATTQWGALGLEEAAGFSFGYGSMVGCTATDAKELATCLRGKTVDELFQPFRENPMLGVQFPLRTSIDGQFLPRQPRDMYADGEINNVAVIVGSLSDEGNMFIMPAFMGLEGNDKPVMNETVFRMTVGMFVPNLDDASIDVIKLTYMTPEELANPEADYADVFSAAMGDIMFVCSSFELAEQVATTGLPSYPYFMTHAPSTSVWGKHLTWLGATHGEDLAYVFGSPLMTEAGDPEQDPDFGGRFNDEEVEMAKQIMKYWANFAKTRNPNLAAKDGTDDSSYPTWPAYTKENPVYKELSKTFENGFGNPTPKRCHFVLNVLPKLNANTVELARLKALLEEKVNADSGKSCDGESCP